MNGDEIFFDPSRNFNMAPFYVEWIAQGDEEFAVDYLKRANAMSTDHGLIYRHNKLGRRMKRDSKEPISRVWLLHGVPRTWSVEQATMAMETAFTNVELLRQSRRQGAVEYIFRGTSATANGTIAIPVETEDNDILTLWARWAPPRKNNQMMQKCHASGSWSLLPPKSPFATETVCAPVEKEASNAKTTDNKEVLNSAPASGKKGKHENASNPPDSSQASASRATCTSSWCQCAISARGWQLPFSCYESRHCKDHQG